MTTIPDALHVRARYAALRAEGVTQKQLADHAKVGTSSVSRLMRGRTLRADILMRLHAAVSELEHEHSQAAEGARPRSVALRELGTTLRQLAVLLPQLLDDRPR